MNTTEILFAIFCIMVVGIGLVLLYITEKYGS